MTHKPTDSLMAAINRTIEGWKVGDYVDMSDVITILTDCRARLSTILCGTCGGDGFLDENVKIVKFRDTSNPGAWYLTDFTMEQVERRLNYLEKENAALRKEIEAILAKYAELWGEVNQY